VITNPNGDIAEDAGGGRGRQLQRHGAPVCQRLLGHADGRRSRRLFLSVDTTPPSVAVTKPVANDSVTSIITVTASASDDIRVAGVQFFLDGARSGPRLSIRRIHPLGYHEKHGGGPHPYATARDSAGNTTTSTSVPVTVRAPTLADVGQWPAPSTWPLVAIHTTLLPTGDVLAWDGANQNGAAFVWHPSTKHLHQQEPAGQHILRRPLPAARRPASRRGGPHLQFCRNPRREYLRSGNVELDSGHVHGIWPVVPQRDCAPGSSCARLWAGKTVVMACIATSGDLRSGLDDCRQLPGVKLEDILSALSPSRKGWVVRSDRIVNLRDVRDASITTSFPPTTSTRRSGSAIALGYHRQNTMDMT